MSTQITTRCAVLPDGLHKLGEQAWDDRVHASVITCTACGEQWIVFVPEPPR